MNRRLLGVLALLTAAATAPLAQGRGGQEAPPPPMNIPKDDARIEKLKTEAVADVEAMKEHTQQMVDSIFSFGELGFQETETHRYVVNILKKNGFTVEEGVLGSAWPRHFNRPVAEAAFLNIRKVGMPEWSDADQTLAKAVQKELGGREQRLSTRLPQQLTGPVRDNRGGGSDDIGDISWNVPTITLRYPANIPGLPGHNWSSAIAMATPIAHKGTTAGAKVQAMTIIDLLTKPELVKMAADYFKEQTKTQKYEPLIRAQDTPAIELNKGIMEKYRPEMRKYYYDPTKYKTYLDQLGIKYPTVKK